MGLAGGRVGPLLELGAEVAAEGGEVAYGAQRDQLAGEVADRGAFEIETR